MTLRLGSLFAIGAIAVTGFSACGDAEEAGDEAQPTTGVDTAETNTATESDEFGEADVEAARTALEGVINRDINDPAYHVGGFRSDPAVSPDLIAQIDGVTEEAKKNGATGLDFDPFICAQNIPTKVRFVESGAADDRVTLIGVFAFGPSTEKVTYVMNRTSAGPWQLDSTECVDAALPRGG